MDLKEWLSQKENESMKVISKTKILSRAIALLMSIALVNPVTVFAEGDPVVVNGESEKVIVDNAKGTITLKDDTSANIIVKSGSYTLDLNGHTLQNPQNAADTVQIDLGATLTITGNGTIDNITHQRAAIYNNGTLTIENGTFKRSLEDGSPKGNSYYHTSP